MKKILLATTLVMACGLSAFAQSKFNVTSSSSANPVRFLGGPLSGDKVNSVGADKYWAQLYVGPQGAAPGDLVPAGGAAGVVVIGVNATVFNGVYTFSNIGVSYDAGQTVQLQVRGWLGDKTDGGYGNATIRGGSEIKPYQTKISPPQAASFASWNIVVPEPGSMMLAGLGLSGLLFLRRRK